MISVVIPAFDSEATIARAIESVLAQTYKDYEIIVVDDGSKDGTGDAVRAFGDKVNYIYQENAGVSVARNTALAAAKGEWIAFLDADDQWLPDKLEKQMQLLERKKGLKWCSGIRYHCYGQQKFVVGNIKKITCDLNNTEYFDNYFVAAAKGVCPILTTTIVVRKDVFDELGGFEPGRLRGQDVDMWWRIAHTYPMIGYIAEALAVRYLDVENPVTRKRRFETAKGKNRRELIDRHLELAKEKGDFEVFRPFATKNIKEGLIKMLYFGYKTEVRETIVHFRKLLPWHLRLSVICLSMFPRLTSLVARFVLSSAVKLGLVKQAMRL